MEQQQQEQQSGGKPEQRPQQEVAAVSEGEAGAGGSSAAGAVSVDPETPPAVPSSRRSSAESAVSNKSPTKAGGSLVRGRGSAPSSPKRASVGSVGSSGGQASLPGKRRSASSLSSAPRVGAPLPPAPKASGSQPSSPRKASRSAKPKLQKSVSESDVVVAMANNTSEDLSAPRAASAEYEDVADAVEVALGSAPTTVHGSPAHPTPLAPRQIGSQPPFQPPPASSAPSSATSTPVTLQLQLPPALSVGGTPMHLAPPLVTASGSASNPVSPAASSMGGPQQVASAGSAAAAAPAVCPSMPKLGVPPAQAPPPHPAAAVPQDGVVLGVEALERQQADLEQRRLQAAAEAQMTAKIEAGKQRALVQAQHLEQMQKEAATQQAQAASAAAEQQYMSRTQSMVALAQAPPRPGGLPPRSSSTPPPAMARNSEAGPQDDDTAPSSTCPPPPSRDWTPNQPRRTSSFLKSLKTPLKQLRQSSFHGDQNLGATSASKHGSEALVVPPKDVDGLLEVEGLWREDEVKPLVYGYLRKLGRNGQWQKRWFETDGMHLAYFKSRKRSKMLANLDLCHVGAIQIDKTDSSGCTFTIQVAKRPYFLCAASEPLCKHWVINLNRVKEARIQVGGFQLVEPHFYHGADGSGAGTDRQRTESDECTAPRVVMVANRTRTRAMAPSETEDTMMEMLRQSEEKKADDGDVVPLQLPPQADVGGERGPVSVGGVSSAPPSFHGHGQAVTAAPNLGVVEEGGQPQQGTNLIRPNSPRIISQVSPAVFARWHKRRGTLTKISLRLLRWARSMRDSTKCIGDEDVVMGSPVHPPGRPVEEGFGEHGFSSQPGTQEPTETSDSSQRPTGVGASFSFEGGHAEWINKEKQRNIAENETPDDRGIQTVTSGGSASAAAQSAATGGEGYESEEETRELS